MAAWVNGQDSFGDLERAGWSDPAVAARYAEDFARASDMAAPVLAEAAGAAPGRRALDLCCGQGNVAEALVAAGAEVTGLDFSPAMLELARMRVPAATFQEGDAGEMPFADGAFDLVTIGFGLPHVPDPPRVLAEARRVLRRGGRIAYSVWSPVEESAFAVVFEAIETAGDPGVALPPGPGATDYAVREVAEPALGAAGFSQIAFTSVPSGWKSDDPAYPFEVFRDGTVRGGALLAMQSAEAVAAIRARVEAAVAQRWPDGRIPMPSTVVSATAA